jgi:aerobic carbon-monoxide dehydrogenase medium subunit
MLLREVEYARPASAQDALRLLSEHEGARALAGGQTLINVMKARAASPDVLVDLNGLDELRGIDLATDGTLTLGAMVTYTEIVESVEARARPILGEVCNQIADVQVRNRGTIGGNVCSNDPTNHLPPLLVALGATMTIVGAAGERQVPAPEFFLGVYMTAVGPGELLTGITIPPGRSDGFASVPIGRDGTCIVNAAASLDGGAPCVAVG